MARPRKQEHEKRSARLGPFDVTEAERAYVEDQASAAGVSLAEYGRQRILTGKVALPRSPVDASLLTELNRVGVNLNQIARALNRGRDEDPH
ncbi:plasmid mobilization relaxosome protein MobC, partial [Hoeflea sp. CAU 1731]